VRANAGWHVDQRIPREAAALERQCVAPGLLRRRAGAGGSRRGARKEPRRHGKQQLKGAAVVHQVLDHATGEASEELAPNEM